MFSGSAWRVTSFGEPRAVIELQDMTWDVPAAGHVLIRVAAAGAGFPDRMMVEGNYPLVGQPPFGLGQEAAGEVVAVPAGSTFAVGDRITGITAFQEGWGGYATYAYLREGSAMPIPAAMTDEQAAGFPIGFRTAHAALIERGRVDAGRTVLVLGAAGSAGSAAVQVAKALHTNVIAVAGGQRKIAFCLAHGADHAIDHRTEDVLARVAEITHGSGVDVVYDLVGGELGTAMLATLSRDGLLLLVGQASGAGPSITPISLMVGNHGVLGVLAIPQADATMETAVWARLTTLVADGVINTAVGSVYGYDEVPTMVAELAAAEPGKVVVGVV